MSRGNERGKIFSDTADRLKFLSLLEDYHERYGILIHSFVLMNNHYHLIIETPKANLLIVLGGEQFIEQIKNMVKGKHLSGEIVERTRMLKQVLPGGIIRMVAERYGVNENSIYTRDLRENLPRRAAMYLVYKYTYLSNREAGKLFGGIHYSALRKAFVRFEEELATNKSLSGTITALESHVKT